jgi:hypothetical protein
LKAKSLTFLECGRAFYRRGRRRIASVVHEGVMQEGVVETGVMDVRVIVKVETVQQPELYRSLLANQH